MPTMTIFNFGYCMPTPPTTDQQFCCKLYYLFAFITLIGSGFLQNVIHRTKADEFSFGLAVPILSFPIVWLHTKTKPAENISPRVHVANGSHFCYKSSPSDRLRPAITGFRLDDASLEVCPCATGTIHYGQDSRS